MTLVEDLILQWYTTSQKCHVTARKRSETVFKQSKKRQNNFFDTLSSLRKKNTKAYSIDTCALNLL